MFKSARGFTLIEILIVIALIALIAVPILISFQTSRANQALAASTSRFADHVRSARVFAREAKDKKSWAIKKESDTQYSLISGEKDNPDGWTKEQNYTLDAQVVFIDDFFIWFDIGVGDSNDSHVVKLLASNGKTSKVDININGVVEFKLNE